MIKKRKFKSQRNSNFRKLYSSALDLLSYESYLNDRIRKSVWNIQFDYFLPLVIGTGMDKSSVIVLGYMKNKRDLLVILKRSLASIYLQKPNSSIFDFTPIMGLEVMCKLMDNVVNDLANVSREFTEFLTLNSKLLLKRSPIFRRRLSLGIALSITCLFSLQVCTLKSQNLQTKN